MFGRRQGLAAAMGGAAAWISARTPARGQDKTPAELPKKEPAVDLLGLFKFHYGNQVKSFQAQNAVFRHVVLVGDSITEGFEVEKFLPGRRVLNRGIGGDVIGMNMPADDPRGVLRRLDESVFDCAATDVFLMIGINDLNSGRTVELMEPGYREILSRIKAQAPRVKVHVQSLLPTRGDHARQNPAVREFNARLRRLAAEFGYRYIDLHPLFAGPDQQLRADLTPDGLHLNDAGYVIWRTALEQAMGWPITK